MNMAPTEPAVHGFIKGLEKIKDESSPLTSEQQKEQEKIIKLLSDEYNTQKNEQSNKSILRKRNRFVHLHGTLGGERTVDAVIAMKGKEMAENGMQVAVLNLNFLKRLQTRALYVFLKDDLLKNVKSKVFLKIQEEDADEVDQREMMDYFQDKSEDAPLFIITDETCKEAERIDEVVTDLTNKEARFHFWSSSAFAHGTPDASQRFRLATKYECPPPIKQVMDIIDIDDDDVDITGPHHVPLRRVIFPYDPNRENKDENIRKHLDKLPVCLISHNRKHREPDVWECEICGKILAEYLSDEIMIGEPGLDHNEVFIVGSIQRFESSVSISGLQVSLLDKDIVSEVLFCRRSVRIQDILKTMNKVVVSDSVSMRGVDKKIVIIIPSPREKDQQEQIEKELKSNEDKDSKYKQEKEMQADSEDFKKPIPISKEDEDVLYRRPSLRDDPPDGADEYLQPDLINPQQIKNREQGGKRIEGKIQNKDSESDDDSDVNDNFDLDPSNPKTPERKPYRMRYSVATHQSLLRRAINSLGRFDKDMILDLFMDAPRHAVLFHFAEDDFQIEPDKSPLIP